MGIALVGIGTRPIGKGTTMNSECRRACIPLKIDQRYDHFKSMMD